jgi:hypothetical protein
MGRAPAGARLFSTPFLFMISKVVNHYPLCYGWRIVVRASRRSDAMRKARNIDVALSENLVGSQT